MASNRRGAVLLIALLSLLFGLIGLPPAHAGTLSFGASADTFVNSNSPGSSFGTNTVARVNHGTVEKLSYFKFDVTGIPAGDVVSSATLQLTTSADAQSADTLDVYSVDNSWTEATTYNTRPTLGALVGSLAVGGPNQAASLAVPVTANGTVSFAIWKSTAANGDHLLATRENTTATARPQLTVVSAPPAQTNLKPSTPGADGDNTMVNIRAGDLVHFNGNWTVEAATPPTNVRIEWYVDNVWAANTAYSPQPPGTYGSLSSGTWTATEGAHTLKMVMDPLNDIPESNEADNEATTTFTVAPANSPPPSADAVAAAHGFVNCDDASMTTTRPFASGTTLTTQWKVGSPPNAHTYDLSGVTSTAYPSTASPFATGTTTPPDKTCITGGTIAGTTDDALGWTYYHDTYNASCTRMVGTQQLQVRDLRCHDIEDGLKFLENNNSVGNANTTSFFSSGTYFNRVRDDCIENDFTLGGYLYDSLWDGCNTGISERPAAANGTWTSPAGETVTLDHMLIGLWETWHEADGKSGENALFKWSSSANHLVIKCSVFKVDSVSLNGASSNDIPAGTVVDDSACPGNPTTIVWLGGGSYPGNLQGLPITVTSDVTVWNSAVANWKAAHGY